MASFLLTLDNSKIGDLALGRGVAGEGVRNLIEEQGARRAQTLAAAIGAENIDTNMGGKSRARYTIRRLQRLENEARDGLLSKALR